MASVFSRLMAKLGLDTKEFDKGAAGVERKTKALDHTLSTALSKSTGLGRAFVTGLAGGAVTAAIGALTSNIQETIKGIASIGDEAKKSGLSLQAFQEWKYVAEQNRVGIDALVDGFKELSLRADEWIATGGGSAAESFQRLGFSADDLKRRLKDPSELMLEIVKRLKSLDQAARIRALDELLGGTGGEQFLQLIDKGDAGLRKMIASAHEAGAVFDAGMIAKADELDKKFDALSLKVGNFSKKMAVGMADVVLPMFGQQIGDLFQSEQVGRMILGDDVYDYFDKIGDLTGDQVAQIQTLTRGYEELSGQAISMADGLFAAAIQARKLGDEDISGTLNHASQEMSRLANLFNRGAISGPEFAAGLADIQAAAEGALPQLQAVDDQSFDDVKKKLGEVGKELGLGSGLTAKAAAAWNELRVINGVKLDGLLSRLGDVGQAISNVIGKANALRAALPGADAIMTTGQGLTVDKIELPPSLTPPPPPKPEPPKSGAGDKRPGTGGGARSTRKSAQDLIAEISQETAALMAESKALLEAANAGDIYGDKAEYASVKARLLTAMQQEGIKVTPELAKQIDEVARAYGASAEAADQARQKLDEMQQQAEAGKDAMMGLFGGITGGVPGVMRALSGLLTQIAMVQVANGGMGLLNASGGKGFAALFGSLMEYSFDGGGFTGAGSRSGGIDGKGGFPAILHPNETVIDHTNGSAGGVSFSGGKLTLSDDGTIMAEVTARVSQASMAVAKNVPNQIRAYNANPRKRN